MSAFRDDFLSAVDPFLWLPTSVPFFFRMNCFACNILLGGGGGGGGLTGVLCLGGKGEGHSDGEVPELSSCIGEGVQALNEKFTCNSSSGGGGGRTSSSPP